jgi:hypothetical protein
MGPFAVGVPKKEKRIEGLFRATLLQMTFTWNKLKWKKLNSPCVNGNFSHSYIIVYEYFGLMLEMKKIQSEFQRTTKHVFWQDYFMHMWPTSKARHFELIEHNFFMKWF